MAYSTFDILWVAQIPHREGEPYYKNDNNMPQCKNIDCLFSSSEIWLVLEVIAFSFLDDVCLYSRYVFPSDLTYIMFFTLLDCYFILPEAVMQLITTIMA